MDALPHLQCVQVASPTVHQPAPTAPSSFTFSCSNHSSAELRARGTFRVGPTSFRRSPAGRGLLGLDGMLRPLSCWPYRQTCCTGFAAGFPSTLLHGCHCLICTARQPAPTAPSSFAFSCSNHSSAELRARGPSVSSPPAWRAGHLQSAGHLPPRSLSLADGPAAQPRPAGRALLGLGWNAAPSFSNDVSSAAVSRRHVFVAAAMLLVVRQPLVLALRTEGCGLRLSFIALQD